MSHSVVQIAEPLLELTPDTAAITAITSNVAALAGVHHDSGASAELVDGHLIGGLCPRIQALAEKAVSLQHLCAQYGLKSADVLAVGDGANDMALLKAAGLRAAGVGGVVSC